ncbi:MAG: hypothetical protein IJ600_02835 [Lachnospiraceae bacterium]|nr:hypothetical protein [Lachnospiraceae bacterium]
MSDNKKKPKKHIWPFFLAYLLLLLAVMGVFLYYAHGTLKLYETAQPSHVISAVAESLSANAPGSTLTVLLPDLTPQGGMLPVTVSVVSDIPYTVYEDPSAYLESLQQEIAACGVQYHRDREDFTTGELHYSLYAGPHCFAKTALRPVESETRMLLLNITKWYPQDIRLVREAAACSVEAAIPEGCTLLLNGIAVTDEHITQIEELPGLDYCRPYASIPRQFTYMVDSLYAVPEVLIKDANGREIAAYHPGITAADSRTTAVINSNGAAISGNADIRLSGGQLCISLQPEATAMPESLKEEVLAMAKTYSNFFSADLPGARNSIEPIRHLFLEDSEYLTLAEEYRRNSMVYYESHSNTHFTKEICDDYIAYGPDCFCCHVHLEKSMTIYGRREVTDVTDGIYYFVQQNGRWVIADIQ